MKGALGAASHTPMSLRIHPAPVPCLAPLCPGMCRWRFWTLCSSRPTCGQQVWAPVGFATRAGQPAQPAGPGSDRRRRGPRTSREAAPPCWEVTLGSSDLTAFLSGMEPELPESAGYSLTAVWPRSVGFRQSVLRAAAELLLPTSVWVSFPQAFGHIHRPLLPQNSHLPPHSWAPLRASHPCAHGARGSWHADRMDGVPLAWCWVS